MPKPRLTQNEKRLRGTLQASRVAQPRTIPEIEIAITEATELIESLSFVLQQAKDAIRRDGIQSVVTARNNKNETTTSTKLNPSVKLLLDVPGKIRLARRELVILKEELETATQEESAANEPDEFAGLD
jgi:hypothetical protein